MNFQKVIEGTKAFKKLNPLQRKITLQHANRKHLENGVNVATNIGLDNWKNQNQFNNLNTPIVEEIITENLMPPALLKVQAKIPALYE